MMQGEYKTVIERTMVQLEKNNIHAVYAENGAEARAMLSGLLREGDVIGCGGSVTLDQIDALSLFRSERYHFLDRYAPGLSPDEVKAVLRASLTADVYVSGTNAITEDGYLYNVDGRSNRVAALLYGPERVIIVAGCNKICKNIDEAVQRVKTVAAPANAKRLHCDTPCAKVGVCIAAGEDHEICDGCQRDSRICANYVLSGRQREKGRITVILVGEALGY